MSGESDRRPWAVKTVEKIRLFFKTDNGPLPAQLRVRKAVENIKKKLGDVTPKMPAVYDLEEVRSALKAAWKKHKSLQGLTRRHLRIIPWILFDEKDPPGALEDLASAYMAWLMNERSVMTIIILLRVFLRDYREELPTFNLWREGLFALMADNEARTLVKWRERCRKYSYLKHRGYEEFAEIYKKSDLSAEEFLNQSGLTGELGGAGFLVKAFLCLLVNLEDDLRKNEVAPGRLNRSFDFFVKADGNPRFPQYRVNTIEALLSPFASEGHSDSKILDEIATFLIKTFGDPRLSQDKWHGVASSAKQVILRWLTGVTLEDFFQLLDKTVKMGESSHQWPFRRALWSAYYKRGHITEAWILLGPKAQQYVKTIKNWEDKAHGVLLSGSGVQSNQSVLLLKFRDGLILAEWSHNGKGRFWLPDNKNAPQFYKSSYLRNEVIDYCDFAFIHSGGERYSWQRKVTDWIYHQTGMSIKEYEYKVLR